MTAHLSLVRGDARAGPSFEPPPFALGDRTQRPGELADAVGCVVAADVRTRLESLATRARLPLPVFVVIAVEAERALDEAATASGFAKTDLAVALDAAASTASYGQFDPGPTRALRAYGAALKSAGYRPPSGRGQIELVVVDRLRARWSLAAQETGQSLVDWIDARLDEVERGRELWEIRAAFEGRTLAEWVALQALCCARRSSTVAQTSASA